MQPSPIPIISRELIEYLEEKFPERSASKGDSYADLMFKGGQTSVVRHLREQLKAREKNILETKNVHRT